MSASQGTNGTEESVPIPVHTIREESGSRKTKRKKRARARRRAQEVNGEEEVTSGTNGEEQVTSGNDSGRDDLEINLAAESRLPEVRVNGLKDAQHDDETGYESAVSLPLPKENGTDDEKEKGLKTDEPSESTESPPEPETEETETEEVDSRRTQIEDWFDSRTTQPYRNLTAALQERIIDHIFQHKYSQDDKEWIKCLRHLVWRAVVRANYYWINPDTEQATGKPIPIRVPSGIHESNFEMFVMCCAERADRVGRDLPDSDHVWKVEKEVRKLLSKAEREGMRERLEHLGFLLLFEDERKQGLTLDQMQERIRRAFSDAQLDWWEFEFFKKGPAPPKPPVAGTGLAVAATIWREVVTEWKP